MCILVKVENFDPEFLFLLLCIHAYMRRDRAAYSKLLPGNRVIFSTT